MERRINKLLNTYYKTRILKGVKENQELNGISQLPSIKNVL